MQLDRSTDFCVVIGHLICELERFLDRIGQVEEGTQPGNAPCQDFGAAEDVSHVTRRSRRPVN